MFAVLYKTYDTEGFFTFTDISDEGVITVLNINTKIVSQGCHKYHKCEEFFWEIVSTEDYKKDTIRRIKTDITSFRGFTNDIKNEVLDVFEHSENYAEYD